MPDRAGRLAGGSAARRDDEAMREASSRRRNEADGPPPFSVAGKAGAPASERGEIRDHLVGARLQEGAGVAAPIDAEHEPEAAPPSRLDPGDGVLDYHGAPRGDPQPAGGL